ncbi:hypothetical protein ACOMHN_017547 [Nucella lapillus]
MPRAQLGRRVQCGNQGSQGLAPCPVSAGGQETGQLAAPAVSPGRVVHHVAATVHAVRSQHHGQVEPGHKVGHGQVSQDTRSDTDRCQDTRSDTDRCQDTRSDTDRLGKGDKLCTSKWEMGTSDKSRVVSPEKRNGDKSRVVSPEKRNGDKSRVVSPEKQNGDKSRVVSPEKRNGELRVVEKNEKTRGLSARKRADSGRWDSSD